MTDERLTVLIDLLRRHPDPKSAKLAADELERYINSFDEDSKRLDYCLFRGMMLVNPTSDISDRVAIDLEMLLESGKVAS